MKLIIPGLWEIDEIGDSVHAYLWEWDGGLTLIDTGMPNSAAIILDALARHGRPLHAIKRIIVTHVDLDHTGSLAMLKQATRARVACHAVEKQYVVQPWRRRPAAIWMRPVLWAVTQLPSYRHLPVNPDELMVDGQITPEGFTVVHTPGHTPGHISLLHKARRLLISGDALSNRGGKLRSPLSIYTPDRQNALRSVWKLAKKYGDDYDTVVFGHGPPILRNGGRRVKALASQLFSETI